MAMFAAPTTNELHRGAFYGLFALLILPFLLEFLPLSHWVLDCAASLLNTCVLSCLLRQFLLKNIEHALKTPIKSGLFILFGFGIWVLFTFGFRFVFPDYVNLNDAAVINNLQQSGATGILCTVLFVPVFEELLFRGLLFRGLYDRSPLIAWSACCLLFPLVHILSYLGQYTPLSMLLAFVQYLPAGLLLCFTYHRTGTILAPITIHLLINLFSTLQGGFLWH